MLTSSGNTTRIESGRTLELEDREIATRRDRTTETMKIEDKGHHVTPAENFTEENAGGR
jgi:hypothetical protein